jgi:hypothetical protein
MEKWKRRFFACLVLATVTLFLTGAREVTHDLRRGSARREQVNADLCDWGAALLAEEPGASDAVLTVDAATARMLVQACGCEARELTPSDTERQ